MKFLPTPEQIEIAFRTSADDLSPAQAAEIDPLIQAPHIIRLYNAVRIGINNGLPESRHWRHAMLLALRAGWYLREQAGEVAGIFTGIDEGEIEALLQEIKKDLSIES